MIPNVLDAIFGKYITIPCQKKKPDQKILFFHRDILFSKFEIEKFWSIFFGDQKNFDQNFFDQLCFSTKLFYDQK